MVLAKIRKFGGYMSNMVMPNLGAFVGWGLLAALFIPTGWMPNAEFNKLVGPGLRFMLPTLIGYTAGYNIYGQRGGVIGLFTTMGVIIGSEVPMFSGAMIMGPLSAWLLKKFDGNIGSKVKPGFEMLINNLSLGILGAMLSLIGFITIGPAFNTVVMVFSQGINYLMNNGLLPLVSILMCPGQVLFLNNAINHGILSPIAYQQASEIGKSIVFMIDSNCGPLLGTLLSIAVWGKGKAKKTAPLAMFIAGIAGIGEVYFPFILANPIMILATMSGLAVSLFLLVALGGGLVGMPSPGSLIMIAMMTPKDSIVANFVAIACGFIVAFCVGTLLLKVFGSPDDEEADATLSMVDGLSRGNLDAQPELASSASAEASGGQIKMVVVACDSGMGSSAMGASVFKNRLKKEGINHIVVEHAATGAISPDADLVLTLASLIERAKISLNSTKATFLPLDNFLKNENYDEAIRVIKQRNNM
ncbi:PTS mannitol transporter subunit IICB [Propionispora vibrioides]|uniref:PTS system mannitol-specific EIICB component n=1 Tax=Propionispora vibrioides TaxID=112903 RepID=A0A1H8WWV0_9FIRM|nr:PTS mannitol transporter subunit IICB [Propionispora vibrioides]SEP32126.1 PTS system, mannitol-specific IIC component [Propionispora vibrioides]